MTNTVTFASGQTQGAMNRLGSVRFSPVDIVASPTCHGSPITSANPCAVSPVEWNRSDALCVSGLIPALPYYPLPTDYKTNWGLAVCVDTSLVPGGLATDPSPAAPSSTRFRSAGWRSAIFRDA
jgi:hypothetical protein